MQNEEFRNEQQKVLKDIIKQIKVHYFNFLSSLKFENTVDKKHEKDYISPDRTQEENDLEAPPTAMQLNSIMNYQFNFEDELLQQNKGQASFIQLLVQIKKLKQFNSQLCLMLMESSPYSGDKNKRSKPS